MNTRKTFLIFTVLLLTAQNALSQLDIGGGKLFIAGGAEVRAAGNLISTSDILGSGIMVLSGSGNQSINIGGHTIPNLEIDNSDSVILTGNVRIGTNLSFTNGKIVASIFDVTLSDTATANGMGAGKFIEANNTGQVLKELNGDVNLNEIPLGVGANYRPVFLSTNGTANTVVGVRALSSPNPHKPQMISDYIQAYWPITRSTLTGNVTVTGQYVDDDVIGAETNLKGYYFDGVDWSSASETHVNATNRISVPVNAASGTLYAMDKFSLLKTRVFLQGAYNPANGAMDDGLRAPVNYLPAADPYRAQPYNATFIHVNNSVIETVTGTPFANQASANNNIVDWVFLELRTVSTKNSGANTLQTRSALLQRDGDVVDIDGCSPVTFNNVASGKYTIAVRHRNHLGISNDPSTNLDSLGEKKSTAALLNFTVAGNAMIFGDSSAFTISADGKTALWAGNANGNSQTKYQGPANDRAAILTDLGNNELNTLTGYYRSDLNMNGQVKYQGPGNDRAYLLSVILLSGELIVRAQQLPD